MLESVLLGWSKKGSSVGVLWKYHSNQIHILPIKTSFLWWSSTASLSPPSVVHTADLQGHLEVIQGFGRQLLWAGPMRALWVTCETWCKNTHELISTRAQMLESSGSCFPHRFHCKLLLVICAVGMSVLNEFGNTDGFHVSLCSFPKILGSWSVRLHLARRSALCSAKPLWQAQISCFYRGSFACLIQLLRLCLLAEVNLISTFWQGSELLLCLFLRQHKDLYCDPLE